MNSKEVKQLAAQLGADMCGIANIDRFSTAPKGFHPCDVMPSCKSVVVLGKIFPAGTLHCETTVPYTIARNMLSDILDKIAVSLCIELEKCGVIAAPVSAITHAQLDPKTERRRGPISLKHCATAAGLGRIGRNTLIINPEYGNMVWLNAVLAASELEADEMLTGEACPEGCSVCIDSCPVNALGSHEMNQLACSAHAFHIDDGEQFTFKCHACRSKCPNCFGEKMKGKAI